LCGILCIAGGVVLVVLQVPEIQLSLTPTIIWYHVIRQQRAYIYLTLLAVFVPTWISCVLPRHSGRHPIIYLLLCSAIASVTVVSSRAFSSILTDSLAAGDLLPIFHPVALVALALIIVTAIWSTAYLQKAMALFDNNQVVPVYYVTFTLASVCAGAIIYREFDCMDASQPPLFTLGCMTTFGGVFLAASSRRVSSTDTRASGSRARTQPAAVLGRMAMSSEEKARRHVELLDGEDGAEPHHESPQAAGHGSPPGAVGAGTAPHTATPMTAAVEGGNGSPSGGHPTPATLPPEPPSASPHSRRLRALDGTEESDSGGRGAASRV